MTILKIPLDRHGTLKHCSNCYNEDNESVPAEYLVDGVHHVCLAHLLRRLGWLLMGESQ